MTNPIDLSPCGRRTSDADPNPSADNDLPGSVQAETVTRAAREAAWVRYEAFTSSTPEELSFNCDESSLDYDFDSCGTVRIRDPILFHPGGADGPGLAMTDVKQRGLGDCALMAVLAGLAANEEGRALLRSLIAENRDRSGKVVSYTVTLHDGYVVPWRGVPRALALFDQKTQVTVPSEYPKGHAAPSDDGGRRVIWPLVIERAFAQLSGGYDRIRGGGTAQKALALLTGDAGRSIDLSTQPYTALEIQRDLAAGKLVLVLTADELPDEALQLPLVTNHAYLLTEVSGDPARVSLYNPWGSLVSHAVPVDALQRWFNGAVIGSAKGGRQ